MKSWSFDQSLSSVRIFDFDLGLLLIAGHTGRSRCTLPARQPDIPSFTGLSGTQGVLVAPSRSRPMVQNEIYAEGTIGPGILYIAPAQSCLLSYASNERPYGRNAGALFSVGSSGVRLRTFPVASSIM